MNRRITWIGGLLAVALVVVGVSVLSGASSEATATADEDFTGKTLVVYFGGAEQVTYVQSARLSRIGGKVFLCGTTADSGMKDDWSRGLTVRIAWDNVERFYPLTAEQYKRAQEANKQFQEAPAAEAPPAVSR
jgi:hypothetical protein